MRTQQSNANQHTDGVGGSVQYSVFSAEGAKTRSGNPWQLGGLARGISSPSSILPTFQSSILLLLLLAAGMMAGTAYGQKATGGTSTNLVGNYWVHTFTNVGTAQFTPNPGENLTVQYLVVGGGGGGGSGNSGAWSAGGGGAGGLITSVNGCYSGGGTPGVGSPRSLAPALTASTAYDVTVGDGGTTGNNGQDSVFGNTGNEFARAKGGGAGGSTGAGNGAVGGSGGGAGGNSSTGGKGGSGIVIIRYTYSPPAGTVFLFR